MQKFCEICEHEIKDGDPVVALVVSIFRQIPSMKSFAIEKPTSCISLEHAQCQEEFGPDCEVLE